MSSQTIADLMVATLRNAEVKRIYGVVGDSLNGITDSMQRDGHIAFMHMRHEEAAAFAASAEAQLTGRLAVCAGSCGPGNLHLINGLFDAHRTRVPVLAIAAQIPSIEIGSGYFQETHPEHLFKECSHFCEIVTSAEQMPRMLESAIKAAVGQRGVAVLVIPGDVALLPANAEPSPAAGLLPAPPVSRPADTELAALAALLNKGERITLFCGRGCAGAHDQLMQLAERLKSPIVHSLGGKEHVEWENPYDVGMTGLIGFSSGFHAMKDCDTLLMLGTDFPYRQFFPTHATIAQLDIRPQNLGRRCRLDLGLVGDVGATIDALLPLLQAKTDSAHLDDARANYAKAREGLDDLATGEAGHRPIHPQFVAKTISELATDDAVFTFDVGTPTIWTARYIKTSRTRRLLGSLAHGSMANAMPMAIGAQATHPKRQVISLSGDGGFTMMMGDFITLAQLNLPVKVVIFNNGLLGFVELEMKAAGFTDFAVNLQNPDFAAMANAMGIHGTRVEDPADLRGALEAAFAHPGPALVDVLTNPQELAMPPKIELGAAKGFALWAARSVLNGRGDEVIELLETNPIRGYFR
jgi:pyruvate dehydrogenase (quinone)